MAFKSIHNNLMTSFLLIGIVPVIIILAVSYMVMTRNIRSEVNDQIRLTREIEKAVVEDFFNSYLNELEYFAIGDVHSKNVATVVDAFRNIDFPELKGNELIRLQAYYDSVATSFNSTGLVNVKYQDWVPEAAAGRALQYKYMIDQSSYSFHAYEKIYGTIHSAVQIITDKFELSDFIIIDNETGYVVYTDNKGMDFGINLNNARYGNTTLWKTFNKAKALEFGESIMTDLYPYMAVGMQPRLLFAAPVYSNGTSVATLIFQIDSKNLNSFMTHDQKWSESGFNQTGESYIIGEDARMRTSSRFFIENQDQFMEQVRPIVGDSVSDLVEKFSSTILILPVKTEAADSALTGVTNTIVGIDYRGEKVLTSYTPLNIKGMNWAIISQIDHHEAFARIKQYSLRILGIFAVIILFIIIFAIRSANRFVRPINVLMEGTVEIEKDNLDISLDPVTEDEMKTLTEMFNSMVTSIRTNREELRGLYNQVSEKQQEITDSITYSLRIQQAALPEDKFIEQAFKESFVLYRPKDIVSGDYYWYHQLGKKFVVVAADCTGHGVPGAFISLLGIRFLRRAIMDDHMVTPSLILERLRDELGNFFEKVKDQDGDEIKDGMDVAVCTFDSEHNTLEYAGAFNPLCYIRNGEMKMIKADRQAVSAQAFGEVAPFTNHTMRVEEGDQFYIFSDGFPDQLGGPKGKKFMSKKFRELLTTIHQKSMQDQQDFLEESLDNWMEYTEQTDDILVIGFKPF